MFFYSDCFPSFFPFLLFLCLWDDHRLGCGVHTLELWCSLAFTPPMVVLMCSDLVLAEVSCLHSFQTELNLCLNFRESQTVELLRIVLDTGINTEDPILACMLGRQPINHLPIL